jgi:hypothetical protein
MTHFYLTLPSNSSQEFFPNNTLTEFTTKLPSTIELANEWEVGLAEIMFPRSWCTIPKDGIIIVVDYRRCNIERKISLSSKFHNDEDLSETDLDAMVKIKLRGGFYKTMEEVTQELNLAAAGAFAATGIDTSLNPPVFYYRSITRRMYITIPSGMCIEFPSSLESILGLTEAQNPIYNKTDDKLSVRGELSCDLQTGIHALYIYCDLLQFTHVGDIKAPLLRVVDSGGDAGDVVTRYYERPRYVPLQKKNFDSIQIIVRDDLGEKIQFENGKVLLTLHFRRAQNQYLI